MTRRKVLIFYDYFTPAFKAGGPIQSLSNLVKFLSTKYDFFIYTSNKDLDDTLLQVKHDVWQKHESGAMVYYSSKRRPKLNTIIEVIKPIHPEIIYINGLYSLANVIWPLFFVKTRSGFNGTVVIAPRGMLSSSALAIRKWKKKIYLIMMKILLKRSRLLWHATSSEEKKSIEGFLKNPGPIEVAQNIPNIKLYGIEATQMSRVLQEVRLVTIAVISPMKNIVEILKALHLLDQPIRYDLYGPIKDHRYWKECLKLAENLPPNIEFNYKKELEPHLVEQVLSEYDIYMQPSQSENFGHSIFEALQAGLPVITSLNTPWVGLQEFDSGKNVDPIGSSIASAILELIYDIQDQKVFRSKEYVANYLRHKNYTRLYDRLFS